MPRRTTKPRAHDPEAAVLSNARTHGSISPREGVEPWDLSEDQAAYLLRKLVKEGELQMVGRGRGTRYKLGNSRNLGPLVPGLAHESDRTRIEAGLSLDEMLKDLRDPSIEVPEKLLEFRLLVATLRKDCPVLVTFNIRHHFPAGTAVRVLR